MKTRAPSSFLLLLALTACGPRPGAPLATTSAQTAAAGSILGTWAWTPLQSEDGTALLLFRFDANQITVLNRCTFSDGTSLTASATSAAVITATTIQVLQAGNNVVRENGRSCDVSFGSGLVTYSWSGANLVLPTTDAARTGVTLQRIAN